MITSSLADNYKRKFGAVFTPSKWADKLVEKHFFKDWLDGATVLDPTAGEGVFLKSFLKIAKQQGIELTQERISRLFGIELNQTYVNQFYDTIEKEFSIHFPKSNFVQGDIFFQKKEVKTDLLIGNPPWVNFSDLEEYYKEKIKHLYLYYGLVKNQKDLLLGNARTDIATLVVAKAIHSNLKKMEKLFFSFRFLFFKMTVQIKSSEIIIFVELILQLRIF